MHRELILTILLSSILAPFCFAQEREESLDGFSLVQYEDEGAKKWELSGRSAEVEEGKVKIDEVSALTYGEDATLKLKAREGTFDREEDLVHLEKDVVAKTTDGTMLSTDSLDWDAKTKNVSTDVDVTIKRPGLELDGTGANVDLDEKTAELKHDVTANITSAAPDYLRTAPVRRSLGEGGNNEQRTTITCDGPLELNYKKNRATFRNNVKVVDREGTIYADRIDVLFSPEGRKIKCVAAKGNVRIVNGENITYSDKAIYLVDQGRVILPRRPKLVIQSESQ